MRIDFFIKARGRQAPPGDQISFDAAAGKASYLERDLIKNNVVSRKN